MTRICARVSGKRVRVALATAALSVFLAGSARAQDARLLEQALKVTTAMAATGTVAAVADPQAPAPAAPAAPDPDKVTLNFFKGTELSGFVDTYYSYNFNTPKSPCATVGGVAIFNCLHNFDVAHNAFSLNMAELALEKKPTADSRAGFRVDLDYGSAAAIVAGADPSPTSINQNIQQAYLS